MAENIGKVISISGPAVDIQFEESKMPPIFQAIRIVSEGFDVPNPLDVVVEVQQHLGEGRVRCIAMVATEGMVRGMKAIDTGAGITGSGWSGGTHLCKVEVDSLEQFDEALAERPDVIMLDNFSLGDLAEAVRRAAGQAVLEASGGVNLETVRAIAETGVDVISVGALTHSVGVLDIGLDAV